MQRKADDSICQLVMSMAGLRLTRYALRVAHKHETTPEIISDLEDAIEQISFILDSPYDSSDEIDETLQIVPKTVRNDN